MHSTACSREGSTSVLAAARAGRCVDQQPAAHPGPAARGRQPRAKQRLADAGIGAPYADGRESQGDGPQLLRGVAAAAAAGGGGGGGSGGGAEPAPAAQQQRHPAQAHCPGWSKGGWGARGGSPTSGLSLPGMQAPNWAAGNADSAMTQSIGAAWPCALWVRSTAQRVVQDNPSALHPHTVQLMSLSISHAHLTATVHSGGPASARRSRSPRSPAAALAGWKAGGKLRGPACMAADCRRHHRRRRRQAAAARPAPCRPRCSSSRAMLNRQPAGMSGWRPRWRSCGSAACSARCGPRCRGCRQ